MNYWDWHTSDETGAPTASCPGLCLGWDCSDLAGSA